MSEAVIFLKKRQLEEDASPGQRADAELYHEKQSARRTGTVAT
jgi:hypothetical protein